MNPPHTISTALRSSNADDEVHHSHRETQIPEQTLNVALLIIAHIILGGVLFLFPGLSTVHVYVVLGLGVICALFRSPIYSAYVIAYMTGAEVLWRMTDARFSWEGGKYAVILILGLSLLRRRIKVIPVAPLSYFLLLLPSAILTFGAIELSSVRNLISFNLSGPCALFVSVWFFSSFKPTQSQFKNSMLLTVLPIGVTAVYSLLSTLTVSEIRWINDSMSETSGGFGPNQVSTIMGLGVVVAWLLSLLGVKGYLTRILLAVVGGLCFIQGGLTFSRGGITAAVIVISFSALHAIRSKRQRTRLLILLLLVVPVVSFVVLPTLNNFTLGFFEMRFSDTSLSGRDVMIEEELQVFLENPIAGIGPGMGGIIRGGAAHTEMTRLLAEHGLLGATSLFLLVFLAIRQYFKTTNITMRGIQSSLVLWVLVIMTNAAMRLAAVSFVFGLAFASYDFDEQT